MSTDAHAYTNAELRKLYDHGFGRSVKGFRTASDAARFNARWNQLTPSQIRALYPERTQAMTDTEVELLRYEIFEKIRKQGVQGLIDFFGGSLAAMEHALKTGLEAGAGGFTPRSNFTSGAVLMRDILLDIYLFGTGPTGIPDFDQFIHYRAARALEYHLNDRIKQHILSPVESVQ